MIKLRESNSGVKLTFVPARVGIPAINWRSHVLVGHQSPVAPQTGRCVANSGSMEMAIYQQEIVVTTAEHQ